MAWIVAKNKFQNTLEYKNWIHHAVSHEVHIFTKYENRFFNDKTCHIGEDNWIIDGVIMNKKELFEDSQSKSLDAWVSYELHRGNRQFYEKLRGVFTGCFIDSKCDVVTFGNQTGDAPVFYYSSKDVFFASSSFNCIVEYCKEAKLDLSLNQVAINHLLSLGYVVEGHTVVSEIKKLQPGEYLELCDYNVTVKRYHTFDNENQIDVSMEEAIEKIDAEFCKAVKRGLEKDCEYGYSHHLINMSAGLDCKMISFAAKKLGYNNVTNNCYAKYGSDEIQYAYEASKLLGNDFIFMPIDTMNYVYDVEEIIRKNFGLSIYAGSTGCNRMLSNLSFNKFGLEFNGMIGDVVIGSFFPKADIKIKPNVSTITYTDKIEPVLEQVSNWKNHELFALYYRGFQGAVTSHLIRNTHTITYSPYLDVDFLQFCYSLPLEFRYGHKLYWKWIEKKYPEVFNLPTTTYNPYKKKLSKRKLARLLPSEMRRGLVDVLRKLGVLEFLTGNNTMKPQDAMIRQVPAINEFINKYFNDNIGLMDKYPILKKDLIDLFEGNVIEKEMVLTVLAVCKVFQLK